MRYGKQWFGGVVGALMLVLLVVQTGCVSPGRRDSEALEFLKKLVADDQAQQEAGFNGLVGVGEAAMPAIKAAHKGASSKAQERLVKVAVRITVKALRREAVAASPSLNESIDWAGLEKEFGWSITAETARRKLCYKMRSVKNWPPREAVGFVKRYLRHPSEKVRHSALMLCSHTALKDAAPKLLKTALKDSSATVRAAGASGLLARGDRAGVPQAITSLLCDDYEVLRQFDFDSVYGLLLVEGEDDKPATTQWPIGPREAEALCQIVLKAEDSAPRGQAARILAIAGQRQAGGPILKALTMDRDDDSRTVRRFVRALGVLQHRPAVSELLKMVGEAAEAPADVFEPEKDLPTVAAKALANVGDPDSAEKLVGMLGSSNGAVRSMALYCLSLAFDKSITLSGGRLVPGTTGKLEMRDRSKLPAGKELQSEWRKFWESNKRKYPWQEKRHSLRKKK